MIMTPIGSHTRLCELEEEVIFLVAYLLFNVMIWTYTMSGWMKESMMPTNFYLI
jgi:hypothetical protein